MSILSERFQSSQTQKLLPNMFVKCSVELLIKMCPLYVASSISENRNQRQLLLQNVWYPADEDQKVTALASWGNAIPDSQFHPDCLYVIKQGVCTVVLVSGELQLKKIFKKTWTGLHQSMRQSLLPWLLYSFNQKLLLLKELVSSCWAVNVCACWWDKKRRKKKSINEKNCLPQHLLLVPCDQVGHWCGPEKGKGKIGKKSLHFLLLLSN